MIYIGMVCTRSRSRLRCCRVRPSPQLSVDRLPYDLPRAGRYLERLGPDGEMRACYEACGAGYVLQRAMSQWEFACDVIAPSLIPKRPGVQRKHEV